MKSISEILEDYNSNIVKQHTLICYLYRKKEFTCKEITQLFFKNKINISSQEVEDIIEIYMLLLKSSKLSENMKETLKNFEALNSLNFNEYIQIYFWATNIDTDGQNIIVTKKIPISFAKEESIDTQINIVNEDKNKDENPIEDNDELQFMSLKDFSKKINIKSDELLNTLQSLGWIDNNAFFGWMFMEKAKDFGVVGTFISNIYDDKIWPASIIEHDDFNNLLYMNPDVPINSVEEFKSFNIENIPRMSDSEHNDHFVEHVILAYQDKIDKNIIDNIVEAYYTLYREDNPPIYEKYFDKYSIFLDKFGNIKDYFSSVDEINKLNSREIIDLIEKQVQNKIVDIPETTFDNKIKFDSLRDLANEMKIIEDETLSILEGLNLITKNNNIWTITSKAEALGAKQGERGDNDMNNVWPISVIDYINEKSKSSLKNLFQDSDRMEKLIDSISDSEKEKLLIILDE